MNEQEIDQNTQSPEEEVDVDEQEIDQSIPKSSQRTADQKILDYWAAITEVDREWYLKQYGEEQLAQQQIYQEMVEEWESKSDDYKQEFLDRGQGDEHVAMMLQFQKVGDLSDAEMYDYWTDGGTNTLDVSIGDDMDDGSLGTDQLIEPQKIVTRQESGNNSALKWGAGGAVAGAPFGPLGITIGGGAGILGELYMIVLLVTLLKIYLKDKTLQEKTNM